MKHTCTYKHQSQFIEMFKNSPFVKLEDVILTQSGGTPNTKNMEYYEGGNIPWLSSGEINQGYIHSTQKFITQAGLDNSSAKWIPKNSVLIAMYGATAGKVGFSTISLTTNQAVCALLPCRSFEPLFLYYAVLQKSDWMISQCRGAAQPNISQGIIRSMEILHPSLDCQRQFVSIAEQADKSKFDGFKSQFIEMFGNIQDTSTWDSVLTITNGKKYPGEYREKGTYKICGSGGTMGYGEISMCPANTVIIGRKGNINSPIFMDEPYWIVDTAFCLQPNEQLNPVYLYYWCKQFDFTRLNKQAVLPSLTKNDLYSIIMAIPPMSLQEEFAAIVRQADKSKYYVQNILNYICHILTKQIPLRRCS